MSQGDILKRYLDAGLAFTQMTRERAEAIVQDLVTEGEIRRKEAEKRIEELVERSQRNTEELLGLIRREVSEQLRGLGLEDLAKRAGGPAAPEPVPATATTAPAVTAAKAAVPKKAGVKKAGVKKAAAGKKAATAKKSTKAAKKT